MEEGTYSELVDDLVQLVRGSRAVVVIREPVVVGANTSGKHQRKKKQNKRKKVKKITAKSIRTKIALQDDETQKKLILNKEK